MKRITMMCYAIATLSATGLCGCALGGTEPSGGHLENEGSAGCTLPTGDRSFAQQATDLAHLDGSCVPEYSSADLSAAFLAIRDRRPLSVVERPDLARRMPWLLIDNGCEERAAASAYFLTQWSYPTPYYARVKAKARKTLYIESPDLPAGKVSWTSHVAPVVRVGDLLMVMDPATGRDGPATIEDWMKLFSKPEDVDLALCRDFERGDGCFAAAPVTPRVPVIPAKPYDLYMYDRLTTEWRVQELLGRDPERVLGDCPPWLSCGTPEPTPEPTRPPTVRRFASEEFTTSVWGDIYIIGDNFVPGLTSVRVTGNGVDELAPIRKINRMRILLDKTYAPGEYQVTVANDTLAAAPATLTAEFTRWRSPKPVDRDHRKRSIAIGGPTGAGADPGQIPG